MAKALLAYMNSDPQSAALLANENRRLRARVSDLEAVVIRLAEENDALIAEKAERLILTEAAGDALPAMQLV